MEKTDPIKIARLCRCRICRDAFALRCEERPDFEVVANWQRLDGDFERLVSADPQVVILDLDLADGAFDVAETIRNQLPRAELVIVASKISDLCLKQALALGAKGIALSSETVDQLLDHAFKVNRGKCSFSPMIASRVCWDSQRQTYCLPQNTTIDSMTAKQLQILRHVARGDSLKMIASKMKLTRKAVDGHKYRLMKKIGVQDRVLLSRYAIREGLIQP